MSWSLASQWDHQAPQPVLLPLDSQGERGATSGTGFPEKATFELVCKDVGLEGMAEHPGHAEA